MQVRVLFGPPIISLFPPPPVKGFTMSLITDIVEYPEEGFAILTDDEGKFLVFRESDEICPLESDAPNVVRTTFELN